MPAIHWSTPIATVTQRLQTAHDALKAAQGADGRVNLQKAKAAACMDVYAAEVIRNLRGLGTSTELSAPDAKRAFLELQTAIRSPEALDTDRDGALSSIELWCGDVSDDLSTRATFAAAQPTERSDRPAAATSRQARQEVEALIVERARFHAATPLGAEALAWDMRLRVAEGRGPEHPAFAHTVTHSETNWKANLPLIGRRSRGQGHLSDGELSKWFGGDLSAFIARAKAEVNVRLMMDYGNYLKGTDLP